MKHLLLNGKIILITGSLLFLISCGKRYTTCDCADLTYDLYKDYDRIIFSEKSLLRKAKDMRKAKKERKKDERYEFCREQGVRPLSIVFYPKNRKIFATCDSWISMEKDIDALWNKIKEKVGFDENEE